ncbi:GNAT family N-acetyltransferase [Peribacillus sp. SCS-26]|uniref:GNAT family N-acetyltransferase n=1 Tax=Paraperibacillus marinus TaxID=3115295 RepID=UPI0039061D9D
MSDLKLMEIQADVLFKHDSSSRLTAVNEEGGGEAPFLFLGQTKEGRILRFNASVPEPVCREIKDIVQSYPMNSALAKIIGAVSENNSVSNLWMGPAYTFPESFQKSSHAVVITEENQEILRQDFPHLIEEFRPRQPIFAMVEEGRAVSVCFSARNSDLAAEAGVETLPGYQGKGYAVNCAGAWGMEIRKEKRIPLYSTSWDNLPSQKIAAKLRLHQYGVDLHVT